ncbi:hypothetical protein HAX54_019038 [Datura stramonium]|uniref:Uncharacterized protein n=1 Tax=Datura stramonium TaxID=4076 RepID=A0ABS8S539_DATST|nr:hypothetical protein [Datura stramonium]
MAAAVANEQVVFDYGNDYGFRQNFYRLKKKFSFYHPYEERSKLLAKEAVVSGPQAIIEDIKNLSNDVYKLSSQEDMLNQFMQQKSEGSFVDSGGSSIHQFRVRRRSMAASLDYLKQRYKIEKGGKRMEVVLVGDGV